MKLHYFCGVLKEGRKYQLHRGGPNQNLVVCGPSEHLLFPVDLLADRLPPKPPHKNFDYPMRQARVRRLNDFWVLSFWDWEVYRHKPIAQFFMAKISPRVHEMRRFQTLVNLLTDYLPRFEDPAVTPFTCVPPPYKPERIRRQLRKDDKDS